MRMKRWFSAFILVLVSGSLFLSGCAVNFYKQSPRSRMKIKELEGKISDLERQRMEEREQFEKIRRMLEKKLKSQIADDDVSFRMGANGLAIILSDKILFDSGKADIRSGAYPVLDKVAAVIVKEVPGKDIGVNGYTDDVPIKHSGWKSNWELSTARATNVLHYLIKKGVSPNKLSATGYGEHRPIASNSTAAGRSKNRRVEIVILPEFITKKDSDTEEFIK